MRNDLTQKRLLTYRHAAELLGVSERTVWTWCRAGTLTPIRFGPVRVRRQQLADGTIREIKHGGTVRIDRNEIESIINTQKGRNNNG